MLFLQNKSSLGAHDDLTVTAVPVTVDRGIGYDDLLVGILVVAWYSLYATGLSVSKVEFLVVFRARELVHTVNMVIRIAVRWENMSSTNRMNCQRVGFLAIGTKCTAENGSRIKLVTAELAHQARAGTIEQSPTHQLFHRGNGSGADVLLDVSETSGVDDVLHPSFLLGNLTLELFDFSRVLGFLKFLDVLVVVGFDFVDFGFGISANHRWLP